MGTTSLDAITDEHADEPTVARGYAWVVFALTFALMISDFMSRQVLNAVFPDLKTEWLLTDLQLSLLSSVVAISVALLTLPLSIVADRWGRVNCIVAMVLVWSLATLGCALARNYEELLAARLLVGVGEAAYASIGGAVVISIFPRHMRATLTAAMTSGGVFGSVFGVALGGIVARHMGWRWSFGVMAIVGVVLVVVYRIVVTERRIGGATGDAKAVEANQPASNLRIGALMRSVFRGRSLKAAYLGNGIQLMSAGALVVWLPSLFNRYYGMALDKAGVTAALFVLFAALGMVVCGAVTDRLSRRAPDRAWLVAACIAFGSFVALTSAMALGSGKAQLALIGCGMFLSVGTMGAAGAITANLTPRSIHSSSFAVLALADNLIGFASGPLLVGWLADRVGLLSALQWIPVASVVAGIAFLLGRTTYARDASDVGEMQIDAPPHSTQPA
ncbi:MFS transporter [Comamonas badia]|uniref:MFS transporter n=1 Tax=Comamonas badia TaxID=265291 RepID=UPI0004084FE1|nr:MFS transporter [Comamonas badia]